MATAKREATRAWPGREYPNEWTRYEADEAEDEQEEPREGEQDNQSETETVEPHYAAGS